MFSYRHMRITIPSKQTLKCHLSHTNLRPTPIPFCAHFGMNIQHTKRRLILVQSLTSRKFPQIGPVRGNGPLQVNKIVFADLLL